MESDQITEAELIRSLADIVRAFRKKEIAELRCENAAARLSLLYNARQAAPVKESTPEAPRNIRDALRQVVNGTPLDYHEIYSELRKRFPEMPASLGNCQLGLQGLRKLGEIDLVKVANKGDRGAPRGVYTRRL